MTIAAARALLRDEIEQKIRTMFPEPASLTPPQVAEALTRIIGRKVGPEQVRRMSNNLEIHDGEGGFLTKDNGVYCTPVRALAQSMTDLVIAPPALATSTGRDPRVGRDLRPLPRGGQRVRQWAVDGPLVFLLDGEPEPDQPCRAVRVVTGPVPDTSAPYAEWAGQVEVALQAHQRHLLNEEARAQAAADLAELFGQVDLDAKPAAPTKLGRLR